MSYPGRDSLYANSTCHLESFSIGYLFGSSVQSMSMAISGATPARKRRYAALRSAVAGLRLFVQGRSELLMVLVAMSLRVGKPKRIVPYLSGEHSISAAGMCVVAERVCQVFYGLKVMFRSLTT